MKPSEPTDKSRGLTAIEGAMALIAVLLVVQVWLLTATLESYLAGHYDAALPGAVISGLLFIACLVLLRFVHALDRSVRK